MADFNRPKEKAKIQIEDLIPRENVKGGFDRSCHLELAPGRSWETKAQEADDASGQGTIKRILLLSPLIVSGIITSGGIASLIFGGWIIVLAAIIGGIAAFLLGGIAKIKTNCNDDNMEGTD